MDAFIRYGFNATKAARAIKVKDKDKARAGHLFARNCNIRKAIDERLREGRASADMVRARLEEHAFSDMGDLLRFEQVEIEGNTKVKVSLDLNKARKKSKLHLVSKIKERSWYDKEKEATVKEIEVDHYSAQNALIHLGKGFGLFEKPEEKQETEGAGVIRGPMRGQLSEEERAQAGNELEPNS